MARDFYEPRGIYSPPFSAESLAGGLIPYTQPLSEGAQNALNGALPGFVENTAASPEN